MLIVPNTLMKRSPVPPRSTDAALHPTRPRKLGAGRAAEVYLDRDRKGRAMVRKIFGGDGAAKLVLYLLTGAVNPYAWCRAAIRAACARRRILAHLVVYWFGGSGRSPRLRLPRWNSWRWNGEHRAHEIRCERIVGRHAPLRGPRDAGRPDPVRDLVKNVMKPLQGHLESAGFDGLLWQTGRGNPVAASNFMLEKPAAGDPPQRLRWVWIDLESGVPALFAMNPLATLGFYLPKSLHHRRWLFDDVDVPKLRRYLWEHRSGIEGAVGRRALVEILHQVEELDRSQTSWKALSRHQRSIACQLSRGRISEEKADYYRRRPLRWAARLAATGAARATRSLARRARRALTRLAALDFRRLAARGFRFCVSQRYRALLGQRLVRGRIRAWAERRFLDRRETDRLVRELKRDDEASYITDFAVHLMIKPPVKALEYVAVPAALGLGWIDAVTAAVLLLTGGLLGRTLYTAGRLVQAYARRQHRPWVALGVGLLPVVGNAAYPTQLLHDGAEKSGELARFILYDILASIGRAVPIWGGADSLTEHWANRLGDVVVRWLGTGPAAVPAARPPAPDSRAADSRAADSRVAAETFGLSSSVH